MYSENIKMIVPDIRGNGTTPRNTYIEHYTNWSDFVDRAVNGCSEMSENSRSSRSNRESRWDLGLGWKGACKLATTGWVEKANAAERIAEPIVEKLTSRIQRAEYYNDVTGDSIDVARFISGYPDCMQAVRYTTVEGSGNKIIHIVYNSAASGGISADSLFNRGVAVVALIHLLELAGYRCQVDIVISVGERGDQSWNSLIFVPIKSADDTVSLPFLMYALAHPAAFRRLWFSIAEQFPRQVRNGISIPGTYGYPMDVPADMRGDIYLDSALAGGKYPCEWSDANSVFEWLMSQLREFNVQLKGETYV